MRFWPPLEGGQKCIQKKVRTCIRFWRSSSTESSKTETKNIASMESSFLDDSVLEMFWRLWDDSVQNGSQNNLILEIELAANSVPPDDLETKLHNFFSERDLPRVEEINRVSPGWNEGVTGKKLKRTLRDARSQVAENA